MTIYNRADPIPLPSRKMYTTPTPNTIKITILLNTIHITRFFVRGGVYLIVLNNTASLPSSVTTFLPTWVDMTAVDEGPTYSGSPTVRGDTNPVMADHESKISNSSYISVPFKLSTIPLAFVNRKHRKVRLKFLF